MDCSVLGAATRAVADARSRNTRRGRRRAVGAGTVARLGARAGGRRVAAPRHPARGVTCLCTFRARGCRCPRSARTFNSRRHDISHGRSGIELGGTNSPRAKQGSLRFPSGSNYDECIRDLCRSVGHSRPIPARACRAPRADRHQARWARKHAAVAQSNAVPLPRRDGAYEATHAKGKPHALGSIRGCARLAGCRDNRLAQSGRRPDQSGERARVRQRFLVGISRDAPCSFEAHDGISRRLDAGQAQRRFLPGAPRSWRAGQALRDNAGP